MTTNGGEAAAAERTCWDLIVIGSGPAGQKAAIQAAKAGRRVALIERERELGGACVHHGTIPSKALRERALRELAVRPVRRVGGPAEGRTGAMAAPETSDECVPLPPLLAGVGEVVAAHDRCITDQLRRNDVTLLHGRARFIDAARVELRAPDGSRRLLRALRCLIATGSRPRAPQAIAIDHEHVLDSDSILSLPYLPRSLIVLGGGIIASEYASIFAALGCRVMQIDRAARPLGFVDDELADRYLAVLRTRGGCFIGGRQIASLHRDPARAQIVARLDDGREVHGDKLFVAQGRVANVEGLGIEAAGVALGASGHVTVDAALRTTAATIYAAGDVIGPPALASAAMEQGRRAARNALGLADLPGTLDAVPIPTGIYTIPEIATVGLDERAARATGVQPRVGRARFSELARGLIDGSADGLLKIVADPQGRRVLGVQAVGPQATELVHLGQLGIAAGLEVGAYVEGIFNFPTLAEAYRVAALDVLRQRAVHDSQANTHWAATLEAI